MSYRVFSIIAIAVAILCLAPIASANYPGICDWDFSPEVRIYVDANFQGECFFFDHDIPYIGDVWLNDVVSS